MPVGFSISLSLFLLPLLGLNPQLLFMGIDPLAPMEVHLFPTAGKLALDLHQSLILATPWAEQVVSIFQPIHLNIASAINGECNAQSRLILYI